MAGMRPRFEREIEEILNKMEEAAPPAPLRVLTPVRSEPRPAARPARVSYRPRVSAAGLMVAALALAVLSSPLQYVYPPAVAFVGVLAAVLLIASLAMSVARWGRSSPEPSWRGRPVDGQSAFWAGNPIARRWRRWRAHRRFRDTRWN